MAEKKELNLDEMEQVVGGKGGSRTRLPDKDGYIVHQIKKGETLKKSQRTMVQPSRKSWL